jgi:hypothetical protein
MLHGVLPFALVLVAIRCNLDPEPVSEAVLPLPNKGVPVRASPHPIAVLPPLVPLALVGLPVSPEVLALALSLASNELPHIHVAVLVNLVAAAFSLVLKPLTFIDTACLVEEDPDAITLTFGRELTHVDSVLIKLDATVWSLSNGAPNVLNELALGNVGLKSFKLLFSDTVLLDL